MLLFNGILKGVKALMILSGILYLERLLYFYGNLHFLNPL